MAPPELSADAPVLDFLKPIEPGLLILLRHNHKVFVSHCITRSLGQVFAVHIPLRF